jgi:cytosine deaminase
MLDVAYLAVHVSQMTGLKQIDACFEMVTGNGARSLYIPDYGLKAGNPANVVVLDAPNAFDAIRHRTKARYVISRGKIIAQSEPGSTTFNSAGIGLSGATSVAN